MFSQDFWSNFKSTLSKSLLLSKWKTSEEKQEFYQLAEMILGHFTDLQKGLSPNDHLPIMQLIDSLADLHSELYSDSTKKRQETLILYRESFSFLKLYLFNPEQVKYYLEHDLNQTYFLKDILN